MPTPVLVNEPVPERVPLIVAIAAALAESTVTVRAPPPRLIGLRRSSVLFAVAAFSTNVVGAKVALPQLICVGLSVPPRATTTGPPNALNPLVPPVIWMYPADVLPRVRSRFWLVSNTPPLIVNKVKEPSPTPSLARSVPALIVVMPL